MNCRDINHLLESHAENALSPRERAAIDQHMNGCSACTEEWTNWRELAALAVPTTPASLGARIAAALPVGEAARHERPQRRRPALYLGALLIAGAAAAAIALRPADSEIGTTGEISNEAPGDDAPIAADTTEAVITTPEIGNRIEAGAAAGTGSDDAPTEAPAGYALDRLSIAVLQRPGAAADAATIADLGRCHAAMVEQLRAIPGLNVIAGAAVAPYQDSGLEKADIARALGAGSVLVVSPPNGCYAQVTETESGAVVTGIMNGSPLPVESWEGLASSLASSVRDALLKDTTTVVAEAKATLLDTSLADGIRASAIHNLFDGLQPVPGAFDSAVIAAAAQIGMSSNDPGARVSVWASLRGIDDPYLIEPLLQSLANDPDSDVRMQAALTLNTFIDAPGVRDALLRAAAEDADQFPTVACCLRTVREAAEYAAVATEDLPNWARSKLLDESLPTRSRLYPIVSGSPDGRFIRLSDLGDDVAPIIFDIGQNEPDPMLRQLAWDALARAPQNDSYVPVLVDDLINHPYEYVRSSAATALAGYADRSDVRTALEQAEQDPSITVRRNAMIALDRPNP